MERPRSNSRRQFAKGMRVCRELQSLLASSFLFDPKEFTCIFLGKDSKNLSIRSRRIGCRPTINRSLYAGDCA